MVTTETLKRDVQEGRVDAAGLIDLVGTLQSELETAQSQLDTTQKQLETAQSQLDTAQDQLKSAQERIAELEKKLAEPEPAKLDKPFSMRAEEKRQEARGRKRDKDKPRPKVKRGRLTTRSKIELASRTEDVYPEGVPQSECRLSHTRVVWRLCGGHAMLVAYRIYRGPNDRYGRIPGVLGRCEFGLEVMVEIAYLSKVTGLSFDKICEVLKFFQNLPLTKSQADALLYRLSKHWEHEFEVLCTLLAFSLVAHTDETGWSLKSVWAFLSEKARVVLYGVPKDADTLRTILDPAVFAGILISDDAAVYAGFTHAQKCWAHLLRKAIKLSLQEPDNAAYREFTDRLLDIYHEACRTQRDDRLTEAGRVLTVIALSNQLTALCQWSGIPEPLAATAAKGDEACDPSAATAVEGAPEPPVGTTRADDYRRLVNELRRLLRAEALFTFVLAPPIEQVDGTTKPVDGTNNEAERTLRGAATARKTGRTNKTQKGARRQTVLTSVLESLRLYLKPYTLASVLDEMQRWWAAGRSCFTDLLAKLKLTLKVTEQSILDRLLPIVPQPSG